MRIQTGGGFGIKFLNLRVAVVGICKAVLCMAFLERFVIFKPLRSENLSAQQDK